MTLFNAFVAMLSSSCPASALSFDDTVSSQTLMGAQVITKTKPDGTVEKADIPWTEAACQEIVLKRGEDGYYSANLIEKDEIFDADRAAFSEAALGEKIIARRVQYCFAKSNQISK